MGKKLDIILHSDYPPETCLAKLSEQIDLDERTLFSLSGFKGKRPILGRIEGNDFRLFERRYWHNSFGPVLFGRMTADGRDTLIEAYWEMWKPVRVYMRVWLAFAVLICTPIFAKSLWCAINSQCSHQENPWVGLVVPPTMVLGGLLLPQLGAGLSFQERRPIAELLAGTLVAGKVLVPNPERSWESSLDRFRVWTQGSRRT